MRKIVSIVFLACLIAPFLGSYIWVQIKRSQIRKEVKWKMIAGIDKKELVFMKFSIKDSQEKLNWKHSKEFEYKGEWYDIVDQEIVGDSIQYHLWWDHEETKLSLQLKELIAYTVNQNPLTKDTKNKVTNLLKSLFIEDKSCNNESNQNTLEQRYICFQKSLYQFDYLRITSPPPKIF